MSDSPIRRHGQEGADGGTAKKALTFLFVLIFLILMPTLSLVAALISASRQEVV